MLLSGQHRHHTKSIDGSVEWGRILKVAALRRMKNCTMYEEITMAS